MRWGATKNSDWESRMRIGYWGSSWGESCGKGDEVVGDKGLETKKGIVLKDEIEITVENKMKRDNETVVKG